MKKAVERYKSLKTRISSTPSHLKKVRALYVRYADDWVIFTNFDRGTVEGLKADIGSYLKSELGLTLSNALTGIAREGDEKTILTDLSKGFAKFLGFRFLNNQKYAPITTYQRNSRSRRTGSVRISIVRQRVVWGLYVDIDHSRVEGRMMLKGLLTDKRRPRAFFMISQLKEH